MNSARGLRSIGPCLLAAAGCALALAASAARAEIFSLENGGQVRGELVNKDEKPRTQYVIKTAAGGQVTLLAEDVTKVEAQKPVEVKYDRLRAAAADTVEGHWELAEFCREHHLADERKLHLERIIAIDPDHAAARRALNYSHVEGRWVTVEQGQTADGKVYYKGDWRLRQEVELMEQSRKEELAEKEWFRRLKQLRGQIDRGKTDQARAKINEINDPYAAKAIAFYLGHEQNREMKMMWVEALSRVGAMSAMDALLTASLADSDEEIRIACMERLRDARYKPAVRRYVAALRDKDNHMVNLAATGLSYMKDSSSVPALIDALVTTHKYTTNPGTPPGQMSSSFGGGGGGGGGAGGFSFGQAQPQVVKQQQQNPEVLRTLVTLAGVNFDYNVPAWKYWYANQKKPANLDARRD